MNLAILDLDGSLPAQVELLERYQPDILPAHVWGPKIRLGCGFGRFRRFGQALAGWAAQGPTTTLYGSGDFHHVSLALVQRLREPFNLLVLDNHPDWMRAVPFLHCGTWLYHAARLPLVRRIFHVGGDVDFDNYYSPLAPWSLLGSYRIVVFPARRRFRSGPWTGIAHEPVRPEERTPVTPDRIEELLRPWQTELARRPLYISLDKDVLPASQAVVNWDSGHLGLEEVETVLEAFVIAAGGRLAGMDIVGDWSPVKVSGLLRRFLHLTEHPALVIDPVWATSCNQGTNRAVIDRITSIMAAERQPAVLSS